MPAPGSVARFTADPGRVNRGGCFAGLAVLLFQSFDVCQILGSTCGQLVLDECGPADDGNLDAGHRHAKRVLQRVVERHPIDRGQYLPINTNSTPPSTNSRSRSG